MHDSGFGMAVDPAAPPTAAFSTQESQTLGNAGLSMQL